eukprot:CAMPEP_0176088668 /NCGR_PEP_ID=MMETSP0120_2-20121206/44396_1 /TAXON_ID=160619 /ORGANISM="Kryptoperidinium foliaceum, Strain CCMP 1326" /LENGTH=368 /DNA_ID=CAMNT_0017422525 /DNA_START=90 /DNA_END=1196 /DNA_ORIENTATION=+
MAAVTAAVPRLLLINAFAHGVFAMAAQGVAHGSRSGANALGGSASSGSGATTIPGAGAMSAASPPIVGAAPEAARPNRTRSPQDGGSSPASGAADGGSRGGSKSVAPGPPIEPTVPENSTDWEDAFLWGLYYSKLVVEASEWPTLMWMYDGDGSLAAVPNHMLRAEGMLASAARAASPASKKREKLAEAALRMYYHAKWLAERNYARAAEWRYREASSVAQEAKRSVLAAHSLSRLGYFLMHWKRPDEAREVLRASEKLNIKSNPLAPFLYGVLERQAAGADVERLKAAEERILSAGKQPSDELEADRQDLIREIGFWRLAEESPRQCLKAHDLVQALICGWVHLAVAVNRACFGGMPELDGLATETS